MATRGFDLSGTHVFSLDAGTSFNLLSLVNKHVYRIHNDGPATITLDWDAPPDPVPLSLEAGSSIDVEVNRLGVLIPSDSASGSYAVGWYKFLG